MLVTFFLQCMMLGKKYVGDIFSAMHDVGDIPVGHQLNNMSECDVGDRYVM